jgi:hypothetical protein
MADDDTGGTGDTPPGLSHAPTTGKPPMDKNKKLGIAFGAAVIIGVGVYLFAKKRSSSSTTSSPATTLVTPTDPNANSGYSSGGYGGSQVGGDNGTGTLSNDLVQAIVTGNQAVVGALTNLPTVSGPVTNNYTTTAPSGGTGGSGTGDSGGNGGNGGNGAAAQQSNPTPSAPNFAYSTVFSNNGVTYYGIPKVSELSAPLAQGYKQTNAKAIGVPGGTTKAQYVYKG